MQKSKKQKIGIRFKLIIIFVLLITLPLIALGTSDYLKSVKVTQTELEESSLQFIEQLNISITNYLEGVEKSVAFIANESAMQEIDSNPDALKNAMKKFEDFKNSNKDVMSIYLGTKDKNMYAYPSTEYRAGYDPTQRPWYTEAIKQQKLIWTQPYQDDVSNKRIVSVAKPVYDKNKELIGVVSADITLETLENMINKTKIGQSGYPFVLDNTGTVIFHKNKELVGKTLPVEAITIAIKTEKEEIVHYSWEEEDGKTYEKFVVYSTLDKLDWKVMANMYVDEIQEKTAVILENILIVGGIALLIAISIAYLFATSLTNPIKTLVKDMEKVSAGDLTIKRKIKRTDEIGQLGENFNRMVAELHKITKETQGVSVAITSSAQNLAATSELTSASAQEVAATIEVIARGASDQAIEAEKSANLTIQLADNFNKLTMNFDHIRTSAQDVIETSETSKVVVNELKEKTKLNNEGTQKVEKAIIDLDNRIKDIGNILATIDTIAGQTNLLALNASIEAARAGDAGKGFTVVAEQIRKLSEESRVSSDEIKEIITNVQKESNHTVGIMKELKERSLAENESVVEVNDSFEKISQSINSVTGKIEEMSCFTNQLNQDKDEIVKSIQSISAVSEETAASSEEVNAAMQQQAMAEEQIATAADKLNVLATKLDGEMSRFKI
ncbi:methyl-accepting chemotaxis protein [Marinisporobacter balticus]|uniref:Methyl-accepting chemotaxis sensory transducer with Cache sensor n=1 Tax=Marinisporobacter balticus TaxID=2018667 RepID=A0A4R2KTI8_9FIRM|nr:methyl-accepting chemotaxis protein [Marinisporobacter balticus]TCO74406.1 methyl-accepting chemotaxis sensory transducer with Cache sensor [Marinisporobacter balticus]